MSFLNKHIAWLIDQLLCLFVAFITGVRPKRADTLPFTPQQKVYFANHNSHGDFVLVWISLPRKWRMHTRPVAGADYWLTSSLKRFIIQNVFNALLIPRNSDNPQAITEQMATALTQGDSLIIFPEGTRNTDDNTLLLPFKSGIYHLAKAKPDTEFVPIWIDNISRVLPKGKILPIPLVCHVQIGDAIKLQDNESKEEFLQRCRQAMLNLAPNHFQAASNPTGEAS
ncbi:lysophospholipid acyltransferase family protein [Wielerella bovis]|uniref:lysophospholipid acyltransferase family protein n=1 Tax=Wielerella bovis TaxID=2917790 RepID=UPI0020197F73|nr:lysophospholipid acyltransferase family protein [Wielerella bovis]ULJ61264.1 1-acyl-sn-glycerol-3-phosphate acyltransferase [Wielerella bovis]